MEKEYHIGLGDDELCPVCCIEFVADGNELGSEAQDLQSGVAILEYCKQHKDLRNEIKAEALNQIYDIANNKVSHPSKAK